MCVYLRAYCPKMLLCLSLDMSRHFANAASIKSKTAGKPWSTIDPATRWEVFMYLLHLADISNPGKFSSLLVWKTVLPQKIMLHVTFFWFVLSKS